MRCAKPGNPSYSAFAVKFYIDSPKPSTQVTLTRTTNGTRAKVPENLFYFLSQKHALYQCYLLNCKYRVEHREWLVWG